MNWKDEKRKQKEAEREQQWIKDEAERNRLANRSMFEKIEEISNFNDVKEILHEFARQLKLEE